MIEKNSFWDDEDEVWKSWTYSSKKNRYYFDDIGDELNEGLWDIKFLSQAYND